jgi:hypothetical protein
MDEPLIPTPIPALVAILLNREKAKGSPLTQEEVESIRDEAVCIMLPASTKKAMDESRGYEDINPECAWQHWRDVRKQLGQEG